MNSSSCILFLLAFSHWVERSMEEPPACFRAVDGVAGTETTPWVVLYPGEAPKRLLLVKMEY